MTPAEIEATVAQFEGLVHETARQILDSGVELEFDDVRQYLRIKVWKAVLAFDAQRAASAKHLSHTRDRYGRSPLQRYVFICVMNMRKDIEKRPRRFNSSIDEIRSRVAAQDNPHGPDYADWFDGRFLRADHEEIYGEVERDDEPLPELAELTPIERQVVMLRMQGRLLCEIDRELGLSRAQRERVLRSVRRKLARLNPADEPRSAPMRPLPHAVPRSPGARAPLAA